MKCSILLRLILLPVFVSGILNASQAQTILIWDDFENYQVGDKVAASSQDWNTWDGMNGGVQDASITDQQFASPGKSMQLGENSKVLLDNETLYEQGQIVTRWGAYIPSDGSAKFGLLQKIEQASFEWGSEIFLNSNGIGQVNPTGTEAATFTFNFDEWIKVEHFVDLDADFAELWIDGNMVHSWQWSKGSTGNQDSKTFQSAAFEKGNNNSGYFIDDVNVLGDGLTSAKESIDLPVLKVFPNPASDAIVVESTDDFVDEMILYDVGGRVVASQYPDPGSKRSRLRVDHVPSGLYILKIRSRNIWQPRRVLIQR